MHRSALGALAPLALSTLVAAPAAAQTFVERAVPLGLDHRFMTGLDRVGNLAPMADWTQQGVGLGDLDGDGDLDVVAVARLLPNHVFRNDGNLFTDVSSAAALDTTAFDNCVALGDYDRDGDLDLFVGALAHGQGPTTPRSRLYRNDGGFLFTDVTAAAGTYGRGRTIGAKWMDLDLDGLLDLYTCEFMGTKDAYYRNNGDGTFRELSAALGLDTGGSTHVVAHFDSDGDGIQDVFPGTDWFVSNAANLVDNTDDVQLSGQPDGTFLDVTVGANYDKTGAPNFGSATMGIAVGDVDYDGDLDMYQTQVDHQFVMVNHGWPASGIPWTKDQLAYGVSNEVANTPTGAGQTVGWGCLFLDADNDPWLDLFKVNGHVSGANPRDQQNYLFRGLGPAGGFAFEDVSTTSGLATFYDARGIAAGDLDQDGDIDLFTAEVAGRLHYYENQTDPAGQGWLVVRPRTTTSAPGAVGTRVSWTDALGYPHLRAIGADGTTAGQNEPIARFGLGTETAVDVTVAFPSGVTRQIRGVQANTVLEVVEPELIRIDQRVLPTFPGTVVAPGVLAAPSTLDPDDARLVVRAFAHDAAGNPLDGTAQVSIEVEGLEPLGGVEHVRGNQFRRAFARPTTPGEHRVEVAFDGFEVAVRPVVTFRGPLAPAAGSVLCAPSAVRAGSADTFEVVVTPRDERGCLLPGIKSVEVASGVAIPPTALAPQGDGTWRATLTAPAAAALLTLQVTVDGVALQSAPTLEVAGPVFGPTCLFYAEKPAADWALMPNQQKMLVTPRDLFGRRLGPGVDVAIGIFPAPGSTPVTLVESTHIGARIGGDHLFVIERPLGSAPNSASGQIFFAIDGVTLFSQPYFF